MEGLLGIEGFWGSVCLRHGCPSINLRMCYNSAENICFGPEYAYFKNEGREAIDIDFVGRYIFETKWVGIYPLLGANYSIETEFRAEKEVKSALGIVFGAGIGFTETLKV